jgi:outer membrane lipoprotein SlyB
MKSLFALVSVLLAGVSASAQVFRPSAVDGALLGGIAGAVIGHNSGSLNHNGWKGAAIGAGVGALLGTAAESHSAYEGRRPVAPDGYVYRSRVGGSYAADGLWVGAVAGGAIGHHRGFTRGRSAWVGAAWGAGAGWLVGSLLDANHGYGRNFFDDGYPRRVIVAERDAVAVQAAPAPSAPQQVTIINNYYGTSSPMSGANSLFGR